MKSETQMLGDSVERTMTPSELKNLTVDGVKGINLDKRAQVPNAKDKFEAELRNQEVIANKKRLPFARAVARFDFDDPIKAEVETQRRKYGRVEHPEKLHLPKIDWKKYSDLKNFEIIDEKEVLDVNLSKVNQGLNVKTRCIKYKFKGYPQVYNIMEMGEDSVARALRKRARLDKVIQGEMKAEDAKKQNKIDKDASIDRD